MDFFVELCVIYTCAFVLSGEASGPAEALAARTINPKEDGSEAGSYLRLIDSCINQVKQVAPPKRKPRAPSGPKPPEWGGKVTFHTPVCFPTP